MKTFLNIHFTKQLLMRKVLYALIPIVSLATYFYGLRILLLLGIVCTFGMITEWVFVRKSSRKISESIFVTTALFTLTLPPNTPYSIAIIGIVFGVIFGKMVFGGFGKNPFNPALVGRAFIYVNFPNALTVQWNEPAHGLLGGFTQYLTPAIDAVSEATPMMLFRSTGQVIPLKELFLGNISGSIGETSAILILMAAIYLIATKTAAKEIVFSVLFSFLVLSSILYYSEFDQILPPLTGLFSGGLLFGATFMATDPISAPRTFEGRILYGSLIGFLTVIIRGFALFSGGIMFAILIGNTFAPIIDELVKSIKSPKKRVQKEETHG